MNCAELAPKYHHYFFFLDISDATEISQKRLEKEF